MTVSITDLAVYPIKSTAPIYQESCEVQNMGLYLDRRWTLSGADQKILTAREFPQLLDVNTKLEGDSLGIYNGLQKIGQTPMASAAPADVDFQLWRQPVNGASVDSSIDDWFSQFLGQSCRLVFRNENSARPMLEKNGAVDGDVVSFADSAPILLMSKASVADLNSRLDQPVGADRFRANIIVDGCEAFAEDSWKNIRIGGVEFDVVQGCKRCVFITIDPQTKEKDPNTEPLRTLATYRRHPNGGASFGVHLIPRSLGRISLGDELDCS